MSGVGEGADGGAGGGDGGSVPEEGGGREEASTQPKYSVGDGRDEEEGSRAVDGSSFDSRETFDGSRCRARSLFHQRHPAEKCILFISLFFWKGKRLSVMALQCKQTNGAAASGRHFPLLPLSRVSALLKDSINPE